MQSFFGEGGVSVKSSRSRESRGGAASKFSLPQNSMFTGLFSKSRSCAGHGIYPGTLSVTSSLDT